MLLLVRSIDFQGGQTLHVFQKGVSQLGVLSPVPAEEILCQLLDQHDGNGDQGNADEQYNGSLQADAAQQSEQDQRSNHGIKELGKIPAEIGFQLVDALHRDLDDFAGGDLFMIIRSQPGQLVIKFAPQLLFRACGSQEGLPPGPDRSGPADGGAEDKHQRPGPDHCRGDFFSQGNPTDQIRQDENHDHVGQQLQQLGDYVKDDMPDGFRVFRQQFSLDQIMFPPIRVFASRAPAAGFGLAS